MPTNSDIIQINDFHCTPELRPGKQREGSQKTSSRTCPQSAKSISISTPFIPMATILVMPGF